jgi:tetratricopeptide (TPR) repeat protein
MGTAGKITSPLTRLLDKGLVRYALGRREEAIALWQEALEQAPKSRRARDYLKSVGALTASQLEAAAAAADSPVITGESEPIDAAVDAVEVEPVPEQELVPPFTAEVTAFDSTDDEEDFEDTERDLKVDSVVPDVDILLRNARAEEGNGQFEAALQHAEEALKRDPDRVEAQELAGSLRKRLAETYRAELEPLEQVPYLTATDSSILELSLDKIGGFLISQIDGEITVDELLTILSTFDEFRVLSSLHFFLENGIIELRSND